MKLEVDRERCVGAGMCVLTAPAVFEQDEEDGRVRLLDPEPADIGDAVQSCPAAAITAKA
ncbi:ferredoxin [Amycolatopsis roodepoortensis]|uniref:ferredoxin n=1 Tax=Amycolatopsis roodepoortensis TaxID=700274 RepID=UPI00214C32E3|nr:ferredoxin [Amycolatopsis roodepoortensis]UUV34894.1 ferredoxin [Amycolatopsis roodepoortensis]